MNGRRRESIGAGFICQSSFSVIKESHDWGLILQANMYVDLSEKLFRIVSARNFFQPATRFIAGNPTPFKMEFDFDFVNLIWIPAAK